MIASIIGRLPGSEQVDVRTRALLHELPGFREPPGREKPRRVDLALVKQNGRRVLASVKWSVRADREEQFAVDFDADARLEDAGEDFDLRLADQRV